MLQLNFCYICTCPNLNRNVQWMQKFKHVSLCHNDAVKVGSIDAHCNTLKSNDVKLAQVVGYIE